jgi:hypothetical protein
MSQGRRLRWTIAGARQHFPTLIRMAAREPQDVYRRTTLVAKVVSPEALQEPGRETARKPLAEALSELQRICAEENYQLPQPARRDRPNLVTQRRKRR